MEQHQFKVIRSNEYEEVYHIIDLTDTSIVGITEMYDTEEKEFRASLFNKLKAKQILAAKVMNYGIFILYDMENAEEQPSSREDYVRSVLRQMAQFFRESVIDVSPDAFSQYYIPQRKRKASVSKDKPKSSATDSGDSKTSLQRPLWEKVKSFIRKKDWRFYALIVWMLLTIAFIVFMLVCPFTHEDVHHILWIVWAALNGVMLAIAFRTM